VVIVAFCAGLAAGTLALAEQSQRPDVPVMVGGDEATDACASAGEIVRLDPQGDGFLSVRSGPGGAPFHEIDRLFNGDQVYVCGENGPWYAVVYHSTRKLDAECRVSTPWRERQPYAGPCRYGWAHSRYIRIIAG